MTQGSNGKTPCSGHIKEQRKDEPSLPMSLPETWERPAITSQDTSRAWEVRDDGSEYEDYGTELDSTQDDGTESDQSEDQVSLVSFDGLVGPLLIPFEQPSKAPSVQM